MAGNKCAQPSKTPFHTRKRAPLADCARDREFHSIQFNK